MTRAAHTLGCLAVTAGLAAAAPAMAGDIDTGTHTDTNMGTGMGMGTGTNTNTNTGTPAAAPAFDGTGTPTVMSLVTENDKYVPGPTDRHFTNGLRVSWLGARREFPDWIGPIGTAFRWLADAAPLAPDPDPGATRFRWIGGAFGQNIYTPENIGRRDLIPDDRPYAGWLYAGLILAEAQGDRRYDEMEIDLGVTGPASLAQSTQINYHNLIGSPRPNGWDNQIETEPGLVISYRSKRRYPLWSAAAPGFGAPLELDLVPSGSVSLGNILTTAQAEATLRVGQKLGGDFGPARIEPALTGSAALVSDDGWAWNVFAGAAGRGVARNIFLDGNTFARSHDVNKNLFVADMQAGVALRVRGVRLSYAYVWRSREFDTQKGADKFGAITLTLAY